MAVAFRSTSTGSSVSSTSSGTITLPSGTTTGDVTIAVWVQARNSYTGTTKPVFTLPSGWTAIYNEGPVAVAYRAYQAGDGNIAAASSTVSDWWESAALTYSGCDTSSPIDTSAVCHGLSTLATFTVQDTNWICPSINPNYNGSMLLCIVTCAQSGGKTLDAAAEDIENHVEVVTAPFERTAW